MLIPSKGDGVSENEKTVWQARRLPQLAMGALMALGLGAAQAKTPSQEYATEGLCDGLPAIHSLTVAPGFCVGLAASNLGFPRGVLALSPDRILVLDRGSWSAPTGRLLELTRAGAGPFQAKALLTSLDRPHGIRQDALGRILIGEASRISWVELGVGAAGAPKLRPIIEGLPATGLHPLKAFAIGRDGAVYVNLGSPSDHCEEPETAAAKAPGKAASAPAPALVAPKAQPASCAQAEGPGARASIWRFARQSGAPERWEGALFARGLRNSMGLAFHPVSKELWQAENSRDTLPAGKFSKTSPPDELNRIQAGKHYGWPYCVGANLKDETLGFVDCSKFSAPVKTFPAHAAPLGMAFLGEADLPEPWRGALVVALHGYQDAGHRLVGMRFDAAGKPQGKWMPLITGWTAAPGKRPMGAPTDMSVDAAGRIWVSEDRNGTLILVAPTSTPQAR